jgi:predicted PurR-regulated permease PerM
MGNGNTSPAAEPELPPSGPGSRARRRFFLIGSAVVACVVLIVAREVLLPFLLAIVLAYVLSPVVDAGQRVRWFGRSAPRALVVVVLYICLLGGLAGVITFSVPRLATELTRLAREAPRIAAQARNQWIPELERRLRDANSRYLGGLDAPSASAHAPGNPAPGPHLDPTAIQVRPRGDGGFEVALPAQGIRITPDGTNAYRITPARPHAEGRDLGGALNDALGGVMNTTERSAVTLFQTARMLALSLSRGIFGFAMTLMLSAYILITSDRIFEFFRLLVRPSRRADFDDLVRRLDGGLAGVVRGQLIICLVNGLLSGIGFALLGLKYWVFLTLVATVMCLVPIFGSIMSTVPAVIVALPQGIGLALLVLAWVVTIHQLEANFLNPKIMGDSARVHPVLVVFALLTGEHLAGIVGALLAVPVLSITQTLFLYMRERFLGVPRNSSAPPSSQRGGAQPAAAVPTAATSSSEPLHGLPGGSSRG